MSRLRKYRSLPEGPPNGSNRPLATIPKQSSGGSDWFAGDVTRPYGVFEDGTYCDWLCAAVGARLVDQT